MPLTVNRAKASFRLHGADFEPWRDRDWARATPRQRRAYWTMIGSLARAAKRAELHAGVDVRGDDFTALAPATLRHRQGAGPPLSPLQARSRFQRLCQYRPGVDGATIFWSHGWARIVGYHAFPKGPRRLPVRDAVGLTAALQSAVKRDARSWWRRVGSRIGAGRRPDVGPPGTAVRGRVAFLPPGGRPDPLARRIQIYTEP
jgi:hypothetical protein